MMHSSVRGKSHAQGWIGRLIVASAICCDVCLIQCSNCMVETSWRTWSRAPSFSSTSFVNLVAPDRVDVHIYSGFESIDRSLRCKATIDQQALSCDPRCVLRSQEADGMRDVLRLTQPTEWMQSDEHLPCFGRAFFQECRVDRYASHRQSSLFRRITWIMVGNKGF